MTPACIHVGIHCVCNTEGAVGLLADWQVLQVMLQTHLSKTAAQQGWTCNWIQRPLNICCTDLQPVCSGCWLLYTGCRSVQQMLRGLWTLKRSSLQMRAVDPLHWAWWSHDKTDLHTQLHGHICSFVCSTNNARAASPVTTKAAGADRQSCRFSY